MMIGVINLSDLNGSNGFVLNGIDGGDLLGDSVSSAGDINGDGFDDVIIGASGASPNGNDAAGESYVVFGGSSGFAPSLDLSSLDGSNGFVINGIDSFDFSGVSVSDAGDVNGDGFDDVIIGASGANSEAGESYVVFGSSGFSPALDLSSLDGSNGFAIEGIGGEDLSGNSVSGVGDVNGDGFDDVIIGAFTADPNGNGAAGESYVVFGGSSGFDPSLDLSSLDGSNGFVINGIDSFDFSGVSVSDAGDVNGDGFDDVIIGAYGANSEAGESYVVFGSSGFSPALDLSSLDGSNGFVLNGIDGEDLSGSSVSSAGDVNGDGIDDVIIGASGGDPNGNGAAGESYVVFGSSGGFDLSLDLSDLDGSNGFAIEGNDSDDNSGSSVSSAGDVNGDGFDDLIIGASGGDPNGNNSGESYVVFGNSGGFDPSLELSALDGSNGFVVNGIDAGDLSGSSVSSAGDVNGDGFDDLIIGASGGDPNGNNSGESYVVFGFSTNTAPDAVDDAVSTDEDTAVTGDVLTNDTDADSDPLTVTEINGNTADVGSQVTLASGALLMVNADGTFDYDPNGQFEFLNDGDTDTDSFTYTVGDGTDTDTATVTVTINGVTDNTPPVALDDNVSTAQNTVLTIAAADLLANDTDADDDSLTVTAVSNPTNGTVTLDTNGDVVFTPATHFSGDATFDYTVFDGIDTDIATVTVAVGDNLFGGNGKDTVIGTAGNDLISGGNGADELNGGAGNDTLDGDNGPDILDGDLGDDLLTGGNGPDIFVLAAGNGTDTITDFQNADEIGLAGCLSFTDLSFSGSDIILTSTSEVLATLMGVDTTNLTPSDFTTV